MDRRTDVPSWKLSDDVSSFNKAETINNKNKSIVNLVLLQPKGVAGNSVPVPRYGKAVHSTNMTKSQLLLTSNTFTNRAHYTNRYRVSVLGE